MKKVLATATLLLFCVGTAFAADDMKDEITFKAKNGDVKFNHKKHIDTLNKDCTTCHGKEKPGKMAKFDKDAAHKLCKGCHQEKSAGPTKCGECHKK